MNTPNNKHDPHSSRTTAPGEPGQPGFNDELIERAARGDLPPELAAELERQEAADPALREQRERATLESATIAADAQRFTDSFDYARARRIVHALRVNDELEVKTASFVFPLFIVGFGTLLIYQASDRDALLAATTTALVAAIIAAIMFIRIKRRAQQSNAATSAGDAVFREQSASLTDRFERVWIRSLASNATSLVVFTGCLVLIIDTGPWWATATCAAFCLYFLIAVARLIAAPQRAARRLQRDILSFLDEDDRAEIRNQRRGETKP